MKKRRETYIYNNNLFATEEPINSITEPLITAKASYRPIAPVEHSSYTYANQVQPKVIFSHFSIYRRIWEYTMFLISCLPVFEMSFFGIVVEEVNNLSMIVFVLPDILYAIDIYIVLHTCYLSHGVQVNDLKKIRKQYGTASIIAHIISAIPFSWIGSFLGKKNIYLILSIPKLLRLRRAIYAYTIFESSLIYNSWVSSLFPVITLMIFMIHMFASLFFLCAIRENSDESWINKLGFGYLSHPQMYVVSIYFVMTTILQIGFGDLTPQTSPETILVIPIQLIGVSMNLFLLSKLVSLSLDHVDKEFLRSTRELLDFIKFKKVPKDIQEDTLNFFQMRYNESKGADDPSVAMRHLPETLRNHIIVDQSRFAFMQVDMFRAASETFLAAVANMLRPRAFTPGEIIIAEGEIKHEMLLLRSGVLKILMRGNEIAQQEFDKGAAFGERELFVPRPRESTLQAVTHVSGWSLSLVDLQICAAHRPDIRRELFSIAKIIFPADVKLIRTLFSTKTLEDLLRMASDSDDDDSDMFIGAQLLESSDSDDAFELI